MSELHQPAENAENAARGHINKGIFRLSPFLLFSNPRVGAFETRRLSSWPNLKSGCQFNQQHLKFTA